MPVGNWNLEWLNHNSQRHYPLVSDGNTTDTSGDFVIPDDFIVELDLPVHAGMDVDPGRFFLYKLGAFSLGYSIVIGYQPTSGDPISVASALVPRQTHKRNTIYSLGGIAPFDDTIGKVVVGRLENIDKQPPGFWTFELVNTRLEPDAVRPIIRGVSSIVCVNNGQRSQPLQGVIELVAGTNMEIVPVIAEGQDPVVVFHAIEGAGTVEPCLCEGDTTPTEPVKKINGIVPTPDGNFSIIGSDCLRVEPIANGVRLVDICSKPCCGCAELERITQDLERLNRQAAAVEEFVQRLHESVHTMDLIVLGSKINDRGCVVCS